MSDYFIAGLHPTSDIVLLRSSSQRQVGRGGQTGQMKTILGGLDVEAQLWGIETDGLCVREREGKVRTP